MAAHCCLAPVSQGRRPSAGAGAVPRQQMGTEAAAPGLNPAAPGRGRLFRANFPAENVKTAASLEFVHL